MPCFRPWRKHRQNKLTGEVWTDLPGLTLPCGQCIGCRLDRSRDWATRITHEAQMHDVNSFITLTYDDQHLPPRFSVEKREMQLFMKRLRMLIEPVRIRYYLCGEYGGQSNRPHYHAIIFGYDFPDKTLWRKTPAGYLTYRSRLLEQAWDKGLSEIGTVSVESAGYVARYVTKKITGDQADEHYQRVNPVTGEIWRVEPEFALMSSRPGIGRTWYDQYSSDAFPDDFVVINGEKRSVPRYYKKQLEASNERAAFDVTVNRLQSAVRHLDNNTPERLAVREEVQELKALSLKRNLEMDQ